MPPIRSILATEKIIDFVLFNFCNDSAAKPVQYHRPRAIADKQHSKHEVGAVG